MRKFYKLENGYPQTYEERDDKALPLEGFKEFTVDSDGNYSELELQDAMAKVKLEQEALASKQVKDDTLAKLTVTITSGKIFYADTESRIDLQSAIASAELTGAISTMWKLAEEFNGARIVEVTLDEIKEASAKALEEKGKLVGAI